MGKFDGILNVFKMSNEDDEDYDDYDGYEDEYEEPAKSSRKAEAPSDDYEPEKKTPRNILAPKASKSMSGKKGNSMNNMEVCVIKPTVFEDCLQVADALLDGRSVVLNLEGVASEPSQRIVDFVSGACYSLKAHFESISKAVYVITPESVYISGVTQDNGFSAGKQY